MLIDCHCHLYEPQFSAADVDALAAEAAAAGVGAGARSRRLRTRQQEASRAHAGPGHSSTGAPPHTTTSPARRRQKHPAAIVTVPESLDDARAVLRLAASSPLTAPCAGLHPVQPLHEGGAHYTGARCVAAAELPPVLELIRASADELVAVGEVGRRQPCRIGGGASANETRKDMACTSRHGWQPSRSDGGSRDCGPLDG
jgi:Tat protein secretion system quality control protein TatD with DNase activity